MFSPHPWQHTHSFPKHLFPKLLAMIENDWCSKCLGVNLLEAWKLLWEFQYFRSLLIFLLCSVLLRQCHGPLDIFCMAGKKLSTSELHGNVQTYLMSCVRALLLSLPAFSTTRTLSSKSFNCLNDPVSNSVKFFTNGLKITIQRLRHWDALRFLLCHDLSIFLHFNLGLNLRTSLLTCKDC